MCTIVLSTVNSNYFGTFIAFASQLIFVLHDCLNLIGGAPKMSKAGNYLSPGAHILKANDVLWVNNGFIS